MASFRVSALHLPRILRTRRARSASALSMAIVLVIMSLRVTSAPAQGIAGNVFPGPGLDDFDGALPAGWTASVWNPRTTRVRYGRLVPGRDGSGACLEIRPTSPMSVGAFRSPVFPVSPASDYLFKAHYASTCGRVTTSRTWQDAEGVSLTGDWLDGDQETVGSFTVVLPETQDRWMEIFEQVRAPATATALQIVVSWRWTGGRLRLDDLSLRPGRIRDYLHEFSIHPAADDVAPAPGDMDPAAGDAFFPIFGWLIPFTGILAHDSYGADLERGPVVSEDRLLAEYALANFTLGNRGTARFGTRFWERVPPSDAELVELSRASGFWGFSGKDEPRVERFSKLAAEHRRIQRLAPGALYWINHLPTYGFGIEGGDALAEYAQFIQTYIDTVRPRLLTYDHYCLQGDAETQAQSWYSPNQEQGFFPNLEIVRSRCLAADVDFGVILSVGTFGGVRGASEGELRWQAFSTLAYGSRLLGWFCYLTEVDYGHWRNWEDMVINRDGTRTRHYAMLKYLNGEVRHLGPTLLRLTSTGVYHTEPLPPMTHSLDDSPLVRAVDGGMALVGEFVDTAGNRYLMVVNRDYGRPAHLRLALRRASAGISRLSRQTARWEQVMAYAADSGVLHLELAAGDGDLLRLD